MDATHPTPLEADAAKRFQQLGNRLGVAPDADTKKELYKTIKDVVQRNNSNSIVYSPDRRTCTAYFTTDGADPQKVISYIDSIINNKYKSKIRLITGRGTTVGRSLMLKFEFVVVNATLNFPNEKYTAIRSFAQEVTVQACKKLDLPLKEEEVGATAEQVTNSLLAELLPKQAGERYVDRKDKRESVIQFIDRVWHDPWIVGGLFTRSYFRSVDPEGEQALRNWLKVEHHELPFQVPRKKDLYDQRFDTEEGRRAAWRLSSALHRRGAERER
jgi:hypothetical protein